MNNRVPTQKQEAGSNGHYRILLIEDNRFDQMAFEQLVRRQQLPYQYRIASCIEEARYILAESRFDLVIADYYLGDGTAFDVFPLLKDTPIIFMTGAGDEEVAVKALRMGAFHYLVKDLDRAHLRCLPLVVENALRYHRIEKENSILSQSLRTIGECVFVCDQENRLIFVNQALLNQLDYTPGELLGKDSQILWGQPPGESGSEAQNLAQEVWLRRKNGEVFPALLTRTRFQPETGAPVVISIARDISLLKQAERELRLAEEKYRTIFQNAPVAITVVDAQERIVSWNRFAEQLLGMTEGDLHLRPVHTLYPPEEWKKIRSYRVRSKGIEPLLESRIICKDGSIRHVDISLSVVRDEGGEISCAIGIIRDNTDRKQAHQALQQYAADLEQTKTKLERKTQELEKAVRLLKTARQKAECAARAKSTFLANMSHELRTPMTGILGMVELMLKNAPRPEQQEYLHLIKNSTDNLLGLINDILDFSKLEAGKLKLVPRPFGLRHFLVDALKNLAFNAHNKGLKLVCYVAPEVPEKVVGDEIRLRQVIHNLVGNAIKFTRQGEVRVIINHPEPDGNHLWVKCKVIDTGIGIPREDQKKIFEPFDQAHLNELGHFEGTGLGLAISSRLVDMMGGTLKVKSPYWTERKRNHENLPEAHGPGSCFYFRIRLARESQKNEPARSFAIPWQSAWLISSHRLERKWLRWLCNQAGLSTVRVFTDPKQWLNQPESGASPRSGKRLIVLDVPENDPAFCQSLLEKFFRQPPAQHWLVLMDFVQYAQFAPQLGQFAQLTCTTKPVGWDAFSRALNTLAGPHAESVTQSTCTFCLPDLRILVVEDNRINQKVLYHMLRTLGQNPIIVSSGQEALQQVMEGQFDLILMDMELPDGKGSEFVRRIHAQPRFQLHPAAVVAISAHRTEILEKECRHCGIEQVINKPFQLRRLHQILEQVARRKRESDSPVELAGTEHMPLPAR